MPRLPNERLERFCQLYASNGGNGTKAYVDAGYSANGANVSASQVLARPYIRERIVELKEVASVRMAAVLDETMDLALHDRKIRVQELTRMYQSVSRLVSARAADPSHLDVPGSETGLLAIKFKETKSGLYKEATFDDSVVTTRQSVLKQVAQELGQWVEKGETEHTVQSIEQLPAKMLDELIELGEKEKQRQATEAANAIQPPSESVQ